MKKTIFKISLSLLFIVARSNAAEICGDTLSARWSYTETSANFLSSKSFPDRYCDKGEKIPGSNVEISLFDSAGKILFRKFAFFPMKHLSHLETDKKNPDVAIKDWKDFAIVQFPKSPELARATKFQIKGLDSLKFMSKGDFKP